MGLFNKTYDKARVGTDIGPRESNPLKRLGGSIKTASQSPAFWTWAGLMSGGLAGGLGGGAAGSLNDVADASKSMNGGSTLGKLGGFFGGKDGFDMDDVLKYGKAAGDISGAYTKTKNADRYRRIAEDEFARRKPLRDRAQQLLLDDSTPDTSATFADPYAPTGRYRRLNIGSRGGY